MRSSALFLIGCCSLLLVLSSPLAIYAQSLSVTAVVPANASSFAAVIERVGMDTVLGQDETVTYTISYGSTLTTSTPITLEAEWTRGTVEGASDPTIDVVDYIPTSATAAYGSTPAVVDTINHKITWSIPSFPANTTNQQVSFQLKTKNTLASATNIYFSVSTDLLGPGLTTPKSTLDQTFQALPSPDPTNTPTPVPSQRNTPTPTQVQSGPTPTLLPSITPSPSVTTQLNYVTVAIRTISSNATGIAIDLTTPGQITVNYGTSVFSLTNKSVDPDPSISHSIQLTDLLPSTKYYYQIIAEDASGKKISDIYTFTTAQPGEAPSPVISTFVAVSGNTIISDPEQRQLNSLDQKNLITLPTSTAYEFRISIQSDTNLTSVQAVLRNNRVLGFSSFLPIVEASTEVVDLVEVSPGIYSGKLKTPTLPGLYDLYLRISDKKGNIVEKQISQIRVSQKLTILSRDTKKPIEGARILLSRWDDKKHSYVLLQSTSQAVPNPSFSLTDGTFPYVLLPGKYKVQVTNLSYEKSITYFVLGTGEDQSYPIIYLQRQPFSIINAFNYYKNGFIEIFVSTTVEYLTLLSSSNRIVDLASFVIALCFVTILILSFISRLHLSLLAIPAYAVYLIKRILHNSAESTTIHGQLIDSLTNKAIKQATLYIKDERSGTIVSHAVTESTGRFVLSKLSQGPYTVSVFAYGYREFTLRGLLPTLSERQLLIALSTHDKDNVRNHVLATFVEFLSRSFEATLILSFIFILIVGLTKNWIPVLPVLVLATINLAVWILHERYQDIPTV